MPIITLLLSIKKGLQHEHVLCLQYDHILIPSNQKKGRAQRLPVRGTSELEEDEHWIRFLHGHEQ